MKTPTEALNAARAGDPAIWIHLPDDVAAAGSGSLAGLPFAVKDNIDVSGMPTTAGCPDYAYQPIKNATVVQRLIDAGAVPVGKTNLDQFATGLVGVRSPYGVPENAFDATYIPGGSSSGSAVAVAKDQVSFALGTDTAGSGRVPAAFNHLIGIKPTRGVFSNFGVVPACKSLDCVSVFAKTVETARKVFQAAAGYDAKDPWSRPDQTQVQKSGPVRFGVPAPSLLNFFGNRDYEILFAAHADHLCALGWQKVEIDFEPFMECARLLYEGPWVAERSAAIEDFITTRPEALHPVTRQIIAGGFEAKAVEVFKAVYRLQELKQLTAAVWQEVDLILTPTAGTHYTLREVEADPVQTNSNLGRYTNYMNLLDLCAVAYPAGFTSAAMPFGVTLQAPALHDLYLLDRVEEVISGTAPPIDKSNWITFAVCGAHLEGLPLNHQITDRGGRLVEKTQSAACFQFVALPGSPAKPGMIRLAEGGVAVALELWEMPLSAFGSFVQGIPPPLGMGSVPLADGRIVKGFICEALAAGTAEDISSYGSWRNFLAARPAPA